MGRPQLDWRQKAYGPERVRTLRSRLFVLLRDELGMGRQPKVARLLVDEILAVVESTLVDATLLRPGQVLVLAPEIGQGPSFHAPRLEDKRLKPVILTLVAEEDIERLVAGDKPRQMRVGRLVRMVREAFEQGVTLTGSQLGVMTGFSPTTISNELARYMQERGVVLPIRGIIEDIGPAISHKAMIIARHLQGETTTEIARATDHTPGSVERYIRRFEQVRELVRCLDQWPELTVMGRILGCSARLVRTYIELIPAEELRIREGQSHS